MFSKISAIKQIRELNKMRMINLLIDKNKQSTQQIQFY